MSLADIAFCGFLVLLALGAYLPTYLEHRAERRRGIVVPMGKRRL